MSLNSWYVISLYDFLQQFCPGSFSSFTETGDTATNLNLTRTESEITVLSRHSERSTEEWRVQSGGLVNSIQISQPASPSTSSDLIDTSRIRKGNFRVFLCLKVSWLLVSVCKLGYKTRLNTNKKRL